MEANTVRVDEQEQEQNQDQDLTLRDFLSDFGEILKERVRNELKPVFDPFNYDDVDKERAERLASLKRKLFPSQEKAVLSLLKGYDAGRNGLILCGEMGVGKTLMGLATAYLLGVKRVLVMCPSHLVQKWIREAKETIPDVRTVTLNGKSMDSLIVRHDVDGLKPAQDVVQRLTLTQSRHCPTAERHFARNAESPCSSRLTGSAGIRRRNSSSGTWAGCGTSSSLTRFTSSKVEQLRRDRHLPTLHAVQRGCLQ